MSAVAAAVALGAGKLALGQKAGRLRPSVLPTEGLSDQRNEDSLFNYGRAAFEPCVGSNFQTRGARGQTINLTLVSVRGYDSSKIAGKITGRIRDTETFSLAFRADQKLPSSGLPTLSHPVLGNFKLFLAPASGLFYEAVVNHIT
jgi:hypothetical protein